jgi:putative NADH-flavin reductase
MQRDIGRHDAEIEALQREIAEMRVELKKITIILSEAKGGWRTLLLVGGAAGTLGAFLVKHWPFS